ncbi:MAG: hypothetical protein V7L14_31355 [Nostoc sp.]|uniref:hypothetical protein n=1 Tax=Nostoc sp. TaxID=1180 RepID=UPI002FF50B9C
MKSLLLGLVLAMSAVLPAAAENWVDINDEGIHPVIMDVDSVLTDRNGSYQFWFMRSDGEFLYQEQAVIDCNNRIIHNGAGKKFTKTGRFLGAYDDSQSAPVTIRVDSTAAIYYNYFCR